LTSWLRPRRREVENIPAHILRQIAEELKNG